MKRLHPAIVCGIVVLALCARSSGQTKLAIAIDGVVNVVNNGGSVTVHQGIQRQVLVNAARHSNKVEVDTSSTANGKRVDVRTHALPAQHPSSNEARVDCDVTMPAGVSLIVSTSTASITLENVSGDISLSSDTGLITVRDATNSHLHIRGVAAPVVLSNVTGHVEVTSSGGSVQLSGVSGPKVTVGTASGDITYQGDFAGGGSYSFTTHSGAINVTLPSTASVDLTARSVNGSVENDFPLQAKSHMTFVPTQGRSFAGTSNSGSSSVELESFSGRIRVKKQ